MIEVKFVSYSLDHIREFEALVNDKKLATINPTFSEKRLIVGIKEEENISLEERLGEIARPCILHNATWCNLLDDYYYILQYLYEKYCKIGRTEIIILYYRNIVEEFSISDLEERSLLLGKLDKWLNTILSKIEKEVKLETILPISKERFGLKINKVPIKIEDNRLNIGYVNEDFYASFVLTSLYNNNDVVKKSLDIIMEQYGIEKIVTAASYELKICEGKMITPYKI